ncbi:MAG: hypothetical protein QOE38_931, partial [Thermoleophilaceae bacterium]|nr:hypothetical protein [Thermoleophilaceae bacterium]
QGNATVIGYHPGGGSRLLVSTAARGARFGKPVALPVSPAPARVSSGPAGQTAVVVDGGNDGLQLLYRPRPDAKFGAPRQIAGPAALALTSTAVDQQGRVLVAWTESDANQRIRLRVMVTGEAGRPTPPSTLSPPDRDIFYGYASVVMNDAGDVAAAWDEADLPSGGTFGTGPPHIYAALRPAGGSFGPARAVTPTGREAALVGPPAVAVQAGGDAILVWADTTSNTDPGQRFMAARLTAGGLVDQTPLDTLAVDKARPAATPPLLRATLDLKQGQRVSAPRGRLRVRVDCTSWTLNPCRGRITIVARGTHRVIASRKIHLGPGSHSALVLHLVRSARRTLARGGTIRATVKATLAGTTASGAAKSVAIRSA